MTKGRLILIGMCAAFLLPLSVAADPLPGETPNIPNAVFLHGKDIKPVAIYDWEQNGAFFHAVEGDGKQVPGNATKEQLRRFRFPGVNVNVMAFSKGTSVRPRITHDEDIIAYTASGRRIEGINDEAFEAEAGDITIYPAGASHHGETLEDAVNVEITIPHADVPGERGVWIHNRDLSATPTATWDVKGKRLYATGEDVQQAPADAARYTSKVFTLPRYVVYEVQMPKGTKSPPADFRATNDGLIYVLKGRLRVTVGSATEIMEGGDAFRQVAGQPYGAAALEDTSYIAMDLPPLGDKRAHGR